MDKNLDIYEPMNRIRGESRQPEISFYTQLPLENLNYEEFKEYAQVRLKVLRRIENNVKDTYTIKSWDEDLVGHSVLKLICCQNKGTAIWFVNLEVQLLKLRLDKNCMDAKRFFLDNFWPHLVMDGQGGCTAGPSTHYDPDHENGLSLGSNAKVHFSRCSDILPKRIYQLRKGYFNLNEDIMRAWICGEFRRYLNKQTTAICDHLQSMPDERFEKIHRVLFSTCVPTGAINKELLAKESLFPLCIRGIIERFKTQRHLKYNDRQALCLFFKDTGLPLEDAIRYFRAHFNVMPDQFNKEYLYALRHNYGMEGKKANYSSFSCAKLAGLTAEPASFGCPFVKNLDFVRRHTDIEDLGNNAHSCCIKHAEKVAGSHLEGAFSSPAEYFRLVDKTINKK